MTDTEIRSLIESVLRCAGFQPDGEGYWRQRPDRPWTVSENEILRFVQQAVRLGRDQ